MHRLSGYMEHRERHSSILLNGRVPLAFDRTTNSYSGATRSHCSSILDWLAQVHVVVARGAGRVPRREIQMGLLEAHIFIRSSEFLEGITKYLRLFCSLRMAVSALRQVRFPLRCLGSERFNAHLY
jgi:hypothetical protein